MKVIQKLIKVEKGEYYFRHLSIINNLLPISLTTKEIQVLAAFMSEEEELIKDDMFNSFVRKRVMDKIGLSSAGLSNYLRILINKGFLKKDNITGKITIKDFLVPEKNFQGYQIKLEIDASEK